VDSTVFKVHKLVVAAWSDWFATVIYSHGDGNKGAEMTWVEEGAGGGGIKYYYKNTILHCLKK
jgi:hypothetical protein